MGKTYRKETKNLNLNMNILGYADKFSVQKDEELHGRERSEDFAIDNFLPVLKYMWLPHYTIRDYRAPQRSEPVCSGELLTMHCWQILWILTC